MTKDWRAVFERTYSTPASGVQERVFRAVFGDDYPEGIDPNSLLSRRELTRFTSEVGVGPAQTLVDVGCGRGGAGIWVARSTGAELIGLDIAETALAEARRRAAAMGMAASFRVGEFERTGLADATADAVMSVDALLFTPDKLAALRELRRILRPGGRLVITSWDYHRQPAGRPPQVADHRPLAEAAGFDVVGYDATDHWRERNTRVGQGLLEAVEELAAEEGSDVEETRAAILEMNASLDAMTRRFFMVAEAR